MLDVKATLAKVVNALANGWTTHGTLTIKVDGADRDGTAPSSAQYKEIMFRDKDSEAIGVIRGIQQTDGRTGLSIGAYGENGSGTQVNNFMGIYVGTNGEKTFAINEKAAFCEALGIGTVVEKSISAVNVATGTTGTALDSISLSAGVWVIVGHARFASNSSGYRTAKVSTTSGNIANGIPQVRVPAVNGEQTSIESITIMNLSANSTTVYLNVTQTSGSSLNVVGYLRAVKVSS